jgi:hypothetical protein
MGQAETATRRDTAVGTLPPVFSSIGQSAETLPGGIAAAIDGTETPAVIISSETLGWTELTYKDQTFVLNKELAIRVTQEEGGWSFESEAYGLLGFGHTRGEADLAFRFDFSICWNEIACMDDKALSRRARAIKQTFLGLVGSVK